MSISIILYPMVKDKWIALLLKITSRVQVIKKWFQKSFNDILSKYNFYADATHVPISKTDAKTLLKMEYRPAKTPRVRTTWFLGYSTWQEVDKWKHFFH